MSRAVITAALLGALLIGHVACVEPEAEEIAWPCLNTPAVAYDPPGDVLLSDQPSLNCFAWKEFISMNWPADTSRPASEFGEPGDLSPVVFETYKNVHAFLKPDGSRPDPRSGGAALPAGFTARSEHARRMSRTSKFRPDFEPSDIDEAFPSPSWLADSGSNLVWYEVLVNEPEFDYFYNNEFYNSIEQYRAVSTGKKIDLPKGQLGGPVGAMEFKAAWLTVSDPGNSRWNRYKLASAVFCSDGECSESTVALVGLHILHKTVSQPSWIWATFEHVENAPDREQVESGVSGEGFTFYSPDCVERKIPASCLGDGQERTKTSCKPNTPPAYDLTLVGGKPSGECLAYPIQVVREFALPNTDENPIRDTNSAAHELIRQANADSVYQYYNLVNVLWDDSPIDENRGGVPPTAPLSETGFRPNPSAFPVANTVLETYIQRFTCVDCHSGASIAKSEADPDPTFAADYSFVFGMAGPKPNATR